MKKLILTILFCAMPVMADYLIYETSTGKIISHDKQMEVRTDENGVIQCMRTPLPVSVGGTTNDMNTTTYTNVAQLVLVPLTPNDVKADFDNWNKEDLKALCRVLLDEINILRVKAGLPERTPTQMKNALKNKL